VALELDLSCRFRLLLPCQTLDSLHSNTFPVMSHTPHFASSHIYRTLLPNIFSCILSLQPTRLQIPAKFRPEFSNSVPFR
jgi:hypothetical protein